MNTEALQKAFETLVRQAYDIAAPSFRERRDSAGLLIITAQRDYILSFNLRTFLRPALIPAFSALLHALHVVLERNRTPEEGVFVLNELHEAVENFARLAWLNPPPPQSPKGGGDGAVR